MDSDGNEEVGLLPYAIAAGAVVAALWWHSQRAAGNAPAPARPDQEALRAARLARLGATAATAAGELTDDTPEGGASAGGEPVVVVPSATRHAPLSVRESPAAPAPAPSPAQARADEAQMEAPASQAPRSPSASAVAPRAQTAAATRHEAAECAASVLLALTGVDLKEAAEREVEAEGAQRAGEGRGAVEAFACDWLHREAQRILCGGPSPGVHHATEAARVAALEQLLAALAACERPAVCPRPPDRSHEPAPPGEASSRSAVRYALGLAAKRALAAALRRLLYDAVSRPQGLTGGAAGGAVGALGGGGATGGMVGGMLGGMGGPAGGAVGGMVGGMMGGGGGAGPPPPSTVGRFVEALCAGRVPKWAMAMLAEPERPDQPAADGDDDAAGAAQPAPPTAAAAAASATESIALSWPAPSVQAQVVTGSILPHLLRPLANSAADDPKPALAALATLTAHAAAPAAVAGLLEAELASWRASQLGMAAMGASAGRLAGSGVGGRRFQSTSTLAAMLSVGTPAVLGEMMGLANRPKTAVRRDGESSPRAPGGSPATAPLACDRPARLPLTPSRGVFEPCACLRRISTGCLRRATVSSPLPSTRSSVAWGRLMRHATSCSSASPPRELARASLSSAG